VSNEVKLTFTDEELRKMSPEDRRSLFGGKDPLNEKEGGFSLSGMSVGMALVIAILLIAATTIVIQYLIRPQIAPPLQHLDFVLPLEENHPVKETELFIITEGYWNQSGFSSFLNTAARLHENELIRDETEARKELYLYQIKAHYFNEDYEKATELARFVQSRYPSDTAFMSDIFYLRGHITLKNRGHREAYGAFAESYLLGGRYSDEAGQAKRRIDRMNRPFW
jgi:hypothetical protein